MAQTRHTDNEGYVRLEGEPDLESQPKSELEMHLLGKEKKEPSHAIALVIADEKIEVEDIDLDSKVKNQLMDPNEFKTLSIRTRTDIMEALQIEMSLLQDIPALQLANALRYLILKNPELRHEMKAGNGPDLFTLQANEFDGFFSNAGSGLARVGLYMADPCSNPFFCLMSSEAQLEACICMSVIAILGCSVWVTGRPAVSTCSSRESSTTKTLKLLTPLALSAGVALLMYRFCAESLGNWGERHNLSRGEGQGVSIFLAAWAMYILSAWIGSSVQCIEEKNPGDVQALRTYLDHHPVSPDALNAVINSNIERLLVTYKKEGDHDPLVRQFSRKVLNEWILRLETLQHDKQMKKIEKEEASQTLTL